MQLEKLSFIIVNANITSRSILREVLKATVYKAKIKYAQNLREARDYLMDGLQYDACFVAFEIGQAEILEFLSGLKAEMQTPPPPFIATIKVRGKDSTSDIASLYLEGISGFISEPYSSNDILKLLTTIRSQTSVQEQPLKLRKAVGLLLSEAIGHVDTLAQEKSKGKKTFSHAMQSMQSLTKSLEILYQQDGESYGRAIADAFEKVPPPKEDLHAKRAKVALKVAPHPGTIVAELMTKRKLTVEGLGNSLKMDLAQFELLLQGKVSVDEDMSRELSRIFGKTSKEWLAMQKEYDVYIEKSTKPS